MTSTIPLSGDEVGTYTPPSLENVIPKPMFRFRAPNPKDQRKFNHLCTLDGLQMFMPDVVRNHVKAVLQENWTSEVFQREVSRLDSIWAQMDQGIELTREDTIALAELSMRTREISPLLRRMEAENARFAEEAPMIALRMYLCGWRNLETPFELEAGMLSEQRLTEVLREVNRLEEQAYADKVVGVVPGMAAMQMATHAFFLMNLDKDAEKNSPAPSPSSETPSGSKTTRKTDGASRGGSKSSSSRAAKTRATASRSSS